MVASYSSCMNALIMDPLAQRVARRHLEAAFIPDKWFKAKRAELKTILAKALPSSPRLWTNSLHYTMRDFFQKLGNDFEGMVKLDPAIKYIQGKVERAIEYTTALAEKIDKTTDDPYSDLDEPYQNLVWRATSACHEVMQAKVKTVGDLYKAEWFLDRGVIERLARKAMKGVTQKELDALADSSGRNPAWYQYQANIGYEKAALKALKRTKLDWNPLDWLDTLWTGLGKFTEQHIQDHDEIPEFTVGGMKFVVVAHPEDRESYAHDYLAGIKRTQALLKAKGFDKVLYGVCFLRPVDTKLTDYEIRDYAASGYDIASYSGVYHIGPDFVKITKDPDEITSTLIHELGHRYWYKFMSQGQRAKFESLVKTKPKTRRPTEISHQARTIPESDVRSAKGKVDALAQEATETIAKFKAAKSKWFKNILDAFEGPLANAGNAFHQDFIPAVHSAGADATINPEVQSLFKDVLENSGVVRKLFADTTYDIYNEVNRTPDAPGLDWNKAYRTVRDKWITRAEELINQAVSSAYIYIDFSVKAYNEKEQSKASDAMKRWDDDQEADKRPVTPVSFYGETNASEAFAEVFKHYVMSLGMNRDQEASFEAVLKTASRCMLDHDHQDLLQTPRMAHRVLQRSRLPLRRGDVAPEVVP